MTWIPSRTGRAIDLSEPTVDQVDFADIAWSLAHLNRYGGHGEQQVSVALHTLIGLDFCPEDLKPHWLLHDAHESRLGEITTPTTQALLAIAGEAGERQRDLLATVIREFKTRHDVVIHAAAGLPMPNAAIREAIRATDLCCLATEHRDFHRPSARKWLHETLGIQPGRTIRKWQAPDKLADQLLARFERYLPALRQARRASAFAGA